RTLFPEAFRLEIAGGVEHLLHARPTTRSLVADHDHVAGLDLAQQDPGHRIVLALEHPRRAGEHQDAFVDAGCLHDAAVDREIAFENRETAIARERMLTVADDAALAVEIQLLPPLLLAEGDLRRHATRRRHVEALHAGAVRLPDVPALERISD